MRNAPKVDKIRHLWSNLTKYRPEVRRVHHIIFPDALLKGIFAVRAPHGAFSYGKNVLEH